MNVNVQELWIGSTVMDDIVPSSGKEVTKLESMYIALLKDAVARIDLSEKSPEELMIALRERRGRLLLPAVSVASGGRKEAPTSDVHAALARQVDYDRFLIALCSCCGVTANAEQFSQPGVERTRLEGALAHLGIAI